MKRLNSISGLQIPEGKKGSFEVKHKRLKKGSKVTVVSTRNAVFTGKKPSYIELKSDHYMTSLLENGKVWMTDSPQEVQQVLDLVQNIEGKVVVGGLGLGVVTQILAWKPDVETITVVEKAHELSELVWPHLTTYNASLVTQDLYKYLRETDETFDYGYFDIWGPTSEMELLENILPLRKLCKEKGIPQDHILCWAESEMLGQVEMGLRSFVAGYQEKGFELVTKWFDEITIDELKRFEPTKYPYYKWYKDTNPTREEAEKKIQEFLTHYLDWHEQYGTEIKAK